jgi:hypothetical protein
LKHKLKQMMIDAGLVRVEYFNMTIGVIAEDHVSMGSYSIETSNPPERTKGVDLFLNENGAVSAQGKHV